MNDHPNRGRFRFTLRTLMLAVLIVSVITATALTKKESQVMWRFSEADGGGIIYGTYYGWPIHYLRVPEGEYANVPADWFGPGLIANAMIALLLLATLRFAWRRVLRTRTACSAKLA